MKSTVVNADTLTEFKVDAGSKIYRSRHDQKRVSAATYLRTPVRPGRRQPDQPNDGQSEEHGAENAAQVAHHRQPEQDGGPEAQNAAHAVVQHRVHALAQGLFFEEEDGPVVREQPWASARGRVWVRRGAEDGTGDTRDGRQRHARDEDPHLPVENVRLCKPRVDARDADVFACQDGIEGAHEAQHAVL